MTVVRNNRIYSDAIKPPIVIADGFFARSDLPLKFAFVAHVPYRVRGYFLEKLWTGAVCVWVEEINFWFTQEKAVSTDLNSFSRDCTEITMIFGTWLWSFENQLCPGVMSFLLLIFVVPEKIDSKVIFLLCGMFSTRWASQFGIGQYEWRITAA